MQYEHLSYFLFPKPKVDIIWIQKALYCLHSLNLHVIFYITDADSATFHPLTGEWECEQYNISKETIRETRRQLRIILKWI